MAEGKGAAKLMGIWNLHRTGLATLGFWTQLHDYWTRDSISFRQAPVWQKCGAAAAASQPLQPVKCCSLVEMMSSMAKEG